MYNRICKKCKSNFEAKSKNKIYCNKCAIELKNIYKEKWVINNRLKRIKVIQDYYQRNRKILIEKRKKWVKENPEKYKAIWRLNTFLRNRKMRFELCCFCKKRANIKHHYDYTKPLKYIPLCRSCHTKLHMALRENKKILRSYPKW